MKRVWLKAWPFIHLELKLIIILANWLDGLRKKNPSSSSSYIWWNLWNFDEFSPFVLVSRSSLKPEVELGAFGLGNSTSLNFGIDVYNQCRRDRDLTFLGTLMWRLKFLHTLNYPICKLELEIELKFCFDFGCTVASFWNCQRQVFLLSNYIPALRRIQFEVVGTCELIENLNLRRTRHL